VKKIRVIRIIARLNIGGPAIHVVLLTAGLNQEKFETLLLSGAISPAEGDMSYYAASKNVKPLCISHLKRELSLWDDIAATFQIYRIINRERPDIIHTHTAKAGTLGRAAGAVYNISHPWRKKIRLIHTFHGHVFRGYFSPFKTKLFILIERFIALFTDILVTLSDSLKEELVSFRITRPDKIRVIPLGFELDEFLRIPLRQRETANIGIIGRLAAVKNHKLFLRAAKELVNARPPAGLKFRIIGDGELGEELREYAKSIGLSGLVEFSGWQKEIAGVYSGLDIIALTSINEGTPVSLIEAMASGLPVVATDAGGVRDLLGDCRGPAEEGYNICERGVIVRSFAPTAFSRAMLRLIEDPRLSASISGSARDFARKRFSKERLFRDIENLYLESLKLSVKMKDYELP